MRVNIPGGETIFTKAVIKDGYIMLGSDKGLYRYDGINFKSYFPHDDSIDFHVTALFEDADDVLWIGCKNGRIYRLEHEILSLFSPEEGTASQSITDIVMSKDHILWWSTSGEGIYFFSEGRVYNINHDDGLSDDYVYDLEIDQEGKVWAGTDGGLISCVYNTGRKIVTPLSSSVKLPDIIVKVIKLDPANNLWLGFQDGGAGYLTPDRTVFIQHDSAQNWNYGPVEDIVHPNGSTWIATTAGNLLELYNSGNEDYLKNLLQSGQFFGKIYNLLEDREGNIWILSASGLYRSTGNRLRFISSIEGKPLGNLHAIKIDESYPNKLWFSDDDGLFALDLEKQSVKKYLGNLDFPTFKITCLFEDKYGYIWAGTFNYGVFRINQADGSWTRISEKDGLVNDNVLAISRHVDTLWMATLGGASEIVLHGSALKNSYTIRSFNYQTGLVNNFIYSVYEDKKDQIWLATDGDGINVKTRKGWITFDEKDGLSDDVIYSITGDNSGNIWAASASKGIFKYDGNKFTNYGLDEGLSSLAISCITALGDELVIINDNGLDVLYIPTGHIAHYGEETGLDEIQPDLNVMSHDSQGNLWLGTRKGIIRYRPGSTDSYSPLTVLEEMSIYLDPRPMKENMVLGYAENHVSFNYSGLWYTNPEKVVYQVMLEGYDLGWKDTYDRQVIYSSLSPGNYTFKVRTSLDRSFTNASEKSFSFRIRGPFWLNPWFITALILVLAGLVYLFIRYREKRLRRLEEEKKEKVEFEFQVLKNQVNPHFLFNSFSTLMSLIEDEPEQAVQYTEKLSDFFRTILQFKDQQVISLEEELSLIVSYFFLLKKRYGDNLYLEINLEEELKKTFIPPMTLQILIENAVKHNIISKDKPLFIKVYEDEGKIVVENNLQPKLTAEISTGIGLENIMKRYRLITNKEVLIEKTDLIFKIILPVIL